MIFYSLKPQDKPRNKLIGTTHGSICGLKIRSVVYRLLVEAHMSITKSEIYTCTLIRLHMFMNENIHSYLTAAKCVLVCVKNYQTVNVSNFIRLIFNYENAPCRHQNQVLHSANVTYRIRLSIGFELTRETHGCHMWSKICCLLAHMPSPPLSCCLFFGFLSYVLLIITCSYFIFWTWSCQVFFRPMCFNVK